MPREPGTSAEADDTGCPLSDDLAADIMLSGAGSTGVPHPAQYRGDPPTGLPQLEQNRMRAP